MKKHKENLFSAKFRLLDSQEHSEEIVWSSSDSSEFEDVDNKANFNVITNNKPNQKRKRKPKGRNNVSNLDITIINVNKDSQGSISPVLSSKTKLKTSKTDHDKTYTISNLLDDNDRKSNLTSPVLCTGTQRANLSMKSPVIPQKFASPVQSPRVRKILFSDSEPKNINLKICHRSVSPVLNQKFQLDRRKTQEFEVKKEIEVSSDTPSTVENDIEFQEYESRVDSRSKNKVNVDLVKKVKSFFDNQFNSENSSQHSIADTPTPKNTSSEDVEIVSITQMTSNESIKTIKHTNSTDNSVIEAEKSKKIRYKKDGPAYRLCSLLKKHSANISLWQHERFLAENSNFKLPKGEHAAYRIKKVNFKYGSYLLEAMDAHDEFFFIMINRNCVNNCIFGVDSILKLYEPYQIFCFQGNRFIVNVSKFECVTIDV